MEIDLTDTALGDLQSIRAYTLETWGEEQEEKYLDEMWDRFEQIQADPNRWRGRDDLFPGCPLAPQGKHVILFRIDDGMLQIVRVLHSAMDFQRHVPNGKNYHLFLSHNDISLPKFSYSPLKQKQPS